MRTPPKRETIMDDLTLEMNRVRQAEITQEILEVVAGPSRSGSTGHFEHHLRPQKRNQWLRTTEPT